MESKSSDINTLPPNIHFKVVCIWKNTNILNKYFNLNQTHHTHLDWISCPPLLQCWWLHRCTSHCRWCWLQSQWVCFHPDWSWTQGQQFIIITSLIVFFCDLSLLIAVLYLSPMFFILLMTSPSFNHWMVGVGVPWARQTSWMLSFSRTPISLGSSDPEILGGTMGETGVSCNPVYLFRNVCNVS